MRKHNYVVGFKGRNNVVYGKINSNGYRWCIHPLSLKTALNVTTKCSCKGTKIYKLVEVKRGRK